MTSKYDAAGVYIHGFTDGRDVDPKSSIKYIDQLEEKLEETGQK